MTEKASSKDEAQSVQYNFLAFLSEAVSICIILLAFGSALHVRDRHAHWRVFQGA